MPPVSNFPTDVYLSPQGVPATTWGCIWEDRGPTYGERGQLSTHVPQSAQVPSARTEYHGYPVSGDIRKQILQQHAVSLLRNSKSLSREKKMDPGQLTYSISHRSQAQSASASGFILSKKCRGGTQEALRIMEIQYYGKAQTTELLDVSNGQPRLSLWHKFNSVSFTFLKVQVPQIESQQLAMYAACGTC